MKAKLSDLYSNGKQLGLRKPYIQWACIKDMTVNEFMNANGFQGIGVGSYKSACNTICKDGHYDRRKNTGRRR